MPIRNEVWTVGDSPVPLAEAKLKSEAQLEDMIVAAPEILSSDWMIIGRQEDTGYGGRIDLLAIAPDGSLILIELKRDRTPRDVVAQAIDYATWAQTLEPDEISAIFNRFSNGDSLGDTFQKRFEQSLDEDTLNESHQIVIVASSLDASSERIVGYLADRDISINVLCFQVFESTNGLLLSRTWLKDPSESQVSSSSRSQTSDKEPWNGEYYASFGQGNARSWDEAKKYGFTCAGGGSWYSGTLKLLKVGDRIWVNAPGFGYLGVGVVTQTATRASDYTLIDDSGTARPALELLTQASYHREWQDDEDRSEYFVSVDWLATKDLDSAVKEVGFFGNQNSVCAPKSSKWRHTVGKLKTAFR